MLHFFLRNWGIFFSKENRTVLKQTVCMLLCVCKVGRECIKMTAKERRKRKQQRKKEEEVEEKHAASTQQYTRRRPNMSAVRVLTQSRAGFFPPKN